MPTSKSGLFLGVTVAPAVAFPLTTSSAAAATNANIVWPSSLEPTPELITGPAIGDVVSGSSPALPIVTEALLDAATITTQAAYTWPIEDEAATHWIDPMSASSITTTILPFPELIARSSQRGPSMGTPMMPPEPPVIEPPPVGPLVVATTTTSASTPQRPTTTTTHSSTSRTTTRPSITTTTHSSTSHTTTRPSTTTTTHSSTSRTNTRPLTTSTTHSSTSTTTRPSSTTTTHSSVSRNLPF
jgi:hypothetical protein